MTLTTPYSATFIVGDGETKTFSYLFEEVSPNFISVMVYNSLTGLISTPTYIIDTDQKQVIFGEDTPAPTADETVCIYRNTPNVQGVAFRTLHGYDAQTLENILSKIVAMIQEIKSNYFSTQVLQGDPWQLDLLSSADDGATVNIDYTAKKLVKGLYFRITNGNLQVSTDGINYITMPKSADVVEFRRHKTVKEDLTVEYRLQYRVGNAWYNAESNAESIANEALQVAEEARDIANDAKDIAQDTSDKVDTFDARLTRAEQDSSDAKELAQEASESVGQFDARITQAEQNANQAKTTVNNHITNYNNPHQVTKAQVGLGNVDNTNDLAKPISTATQTALDNKQNISTTNYQMGNANGRWTTMTLAQQNALNSGATTTNIRQIATNTNNIASEITNRQNADNGLQTQIDAIVSKSDVVDIVGTYSELQAYDTSSLGNNDVVKVISDSTHNNAPSFYRWVITGDVGAWAYIGSEAETYTKAQTDALLNGKQNTISDLATIRSGATLGATAVQPSDLGNGTITITQGGVTKGTFTTNQSEDTTIDLNAGGTTTGQSIDAEIVGTLTVASDGDVSGLDNSNYLVYPGALDMSSASSFEMVFAFTTGNAVSTAYVLNGVGMGYNSEHDIAIAINSSEKLWFYVNASSDTIIGTTTIQPNTKYYVKVVYDGTDYILSLSEDGNNWNTEGSVLVTEKPGPLRGRKYAIGRSVSSVFSVMHMKECYIKENNILVWQGMDAPGLHQRIDTNVSNVSALGKLNIINMVMPDYSQGINVPLTGITQWTAPIDCFVSYQSGLRNGAQEQFFIGGVRIMLHENGTSPWVRTTTLFYMKAGQILTGLAPNDSNRDSTIYYFPLGA